ncbi:hypothetical protein [Rhodospirillaceae bacterium SYSU D60014]|uniref:hypothetical protein n=1 Tax=Virgifigura deserti TaxID=2268457 RepID=UPI000E661E68
MLLGQLPSQITAGSTGMYSGAGYAPALMQAFLNRFGPYRLQPYEVPQIPAQFMAPTFQPRGLRESGLLTPAVPRQWESRFGGNGRTGGGPRSADRNGANRSGGKASGPGGPAGGRSGPVSR